VKIWTVHTKPDAAPILIREGFSFGALIFGPLWLLAHRAWIPAVLSAVAFVLILAVATPRVAIPLCDGIAILLGFYGQDLRRWSLDRAGYTLVHVVVARDEEGALTRLLTRRPDLAAPFLPAGA
jgi:hypothetical protein